MDPNPDTLAREIAAAFEAAYGAELEGDSRERTDTLAAGVARAVDAYIAQAIGATQISRESLPRKHGETHSYGAADQIHIESYQDRILRMVPTAQSSEPPDGILWSVPTIAPIALAGAYPGTQLTNGVQRQIGAFRLPSDFGSVVEAAMVCFLGVTVSGANVQQDVMFATDGESFAEHSVADTTSTYDFVANRWLSVGFGHLLGDANANDNIGYRVLNATGFSLKILGCYIQYSRG